MHVELVLKLLGICNVQLVLKRHKDLSYLLTPSAQELASVHKPITDHLFGENMAEEHEEAQKDFRLTQKLTRKHAKPKSKKSFFNKNITKKARPSAPPLMGIPMTQHGGMPSAFPQYQPGFQNPPFPHRFQPVQPLWRGHPQGSQHRGQKRKNTSKH